MFLSLTVARGESSVRGGKLEGVGRSWTSYREIRVEAPEEDIGEEWIQQQ